jgi:predicted transcriptional regulator
MISRTTKKIGLDALDKKLLASITEQPGISMVEIVKLYPGESRRKLQYRIDTLSKGNWISSILERGSKKLYPVGGYNL